MTANGYTGNPPGGGGGGGGAVDSVNGRTGAVTLSKTDVQLPLVDNTPDSLKPVSTPQATALALKADASTVTASLALKAPLASPTFTGTVSGVSKAMVGLANVDNTADTAKTFTQSQVTNLVTDLSAKAPLSSPALTGNPTAPTQTAGDNSTRLATTAYVTTAVAAVGGGGGGAAPTFARAYLTAGDITPGVTASWTPVTGLTLAVAAVAGEDLTLTLSGLLNQTPADFFDMVIVVGGSIVRYASTGTASPTAANEGDPSIYPISGAAIRSTTATWSLTVGSGDISGGNVTFALAFRGSGTGKVFASTNYPFRWSVRNDH